MSDTRNTTIDRYTLNDHLTAYLQEQGWHAETEDDMTDLNDLVHDVADKIEKLLQGGQDEA